MAQWRKEDEMKAISKNEEEHSKKYSEKVAHLQPTEPTEEWEQEMWSDVYRDASGNILKVRQLREGELGEIQEDVEGENDWEIVSSQSMKQRRMLQAQTDWPLSARGMEEKERIAAKNRRKNNIKGKMLDQDRDDVSNQWSWDNEKESDMSEWLAMPKEEFN